MADKGKQPKKDKHKRIEYKRTKNWGVSIKKPKPKRTRIWA